LAKQFVRNGGRWNWLRIVPKWLAAVSVVVKLLILFPEITMTDSWERDPEDERWMEWPRIVPKWGALVSVVVKRLVLVPESQLITIKDSWERDPEDER
jgi:hypothetical protein